MKLTSKQVQTDVYNILRSSALARALSGEVYRAGYRPRDSRKEDATVIFTAGLADEVQTGVVTINIFVPDIDAFADGTFVENGERTAQIEALAAQWVDTLTAGSSRYLFTLQSAIFTMPDEDLRQHIVVVRLNYKYY